MPILGEFRRAPLRRRRRHAAPRTSDIQGVPGAGDGFTLVELLVVIVVVGILATIALSAFLDQRRKGWDAAVQSDLRNAATVQQTVLADSGAGEFASTIEQLQAAGFRASSDASYYGGAFDMAVSADGGLRYCMTSRSGSGRYFAMSSDFGMASSADPVDPATCI